MKATPIEHGEDLGFGLGPGGARGSNETRGNRSLIGWIGAGPPTYPTSTGLLARELQARVGRRSADELEGKVVGVLPGHLSDQRAVLTLGRECEDSVSVG